MVGDFILSALRVEWFRSRVVSEDQALQVQEEVRALIQAGVGGMDPRVSLLRDEGWRGGHPVGVADSYHVRPQCIIWG